MTRTSRTPKAPDATRRAAESKGDEACPTAAIGRTLATVSAAIATIEQQRPQNSAGNLRAQQLEAQLDDLNDHLITQLSWVTPRSLDGLIVLALGVRSAVDDLCETASVEPEAPAQRKLRRLLGRLFDGLAHVSGHTPADLGLSYWWTGVTGLAPTLSAQGEVQVPSAVCD